MTITYLGANEECKYRQAEISTSGKKSVDTKRDAALLEKTIAILEEMGWKNWDWFGDGDDIVLALHEVADRDEYDDLLVDYKEAKRKAKEQLTISLN